MKVTVALFARARELAGVDRIVVHDLPEPMLVEDVRRELAVMFPRLGGFLPRCRVAVDGEFALDDQVIGETSEVAVLPPVSGG